MGSEGRVVERRVGRAGLAARFAAGTFVIGGVVLGTAIGNDRWWPFAPMTQYAFAVSNSGSISSRYLEARTVDGQIVQVPLGRSLGIERAEIEGQLPRFVDDPSRLQAIAVLYHRHHPDDPAYVELWLKDQVTQLPSRTVSVHTLATWQVVRPENPRELR